ncbi:hypothetical protein ACHAXA_002512 [Cyclostephanos tholiformis]|uniref:Uncharacterized protein n=1 Tax=Cyclostephanos tholiformis TaxID=382380 RepID=A0ABD3SD97_9STRA
MGYEEVETVLPVNFATRQDQAPEQSKATAESGSVQDSDMASAVPAKKRGRRSRVSLWRENRTKYLTRKSKKELETQSASDEKSKSTIAKKNPKSKPESKSRKSSRFSLFTIKSADSNATAVASNTSKSKNVSQSTADAKEELPAIDTSASPPMPTTMQEGRHSPTDSAGTSLTVNSCGEEKADTAQPDESIKADEFFVEVGDEENQYTMQIPSAPDRDYEQSKKEEAVLSPLSKSRSLFSIIKSTRSFNGTTEYDQALSTVSPAAPPEIPSKLSPMFPATAAPAIATALSSDGEASVQTSNSIKSTKSTIFSNIKLSKSNDNKSSKALVVAKDHALEAVDTPEEVNTNTNSEALALVDHASNAKWVKKVSLSIGGYSTSFTVSDPMAAFKDALDVAGSDEGLCQQAKELDGIHANDDYEGDDRDYDDNPTRLFMFIQQRAWSSASAQLQSHPEEAKIWVYRKAMPEKAPNVPDADENKEALVVQHTSLVVHDGRETAKFRWRLLPLHAAIVLGAPSEVIHEIIRAYPNAAQKADERGSLPVHLASSRLDVDPEGEKVVLELLKTYPDSIDVLDRRGRTPPELAKLARSRKEVDEQRKTKSCNSNSNQIATGKNLDEQLKLADKASENAQRKDDDDRSVKSSLSGRFQQMLRKSKSSDSVSRRKKKKKMNKQEDDSEISGLTLVKSVDRGYDDEPAADDVRMTEDLGPGFAFLRTSKNQTTEEDVERELRKEESHVGVKKLIISHEYQLPANSPRCSDSPMNIPLPNSFSLGDDMSLPVSMERMGSTSKSVTIAEELNVDHEADIIEDQDTNEGLLILLEKAAENAGRRGMDVTKFIKILEDEWVTDVEALRRIDGRTLDELLPLMLSRELQQLIHHADSIDNKFLEDRGRGRSPTKKKKKKRSIRRIKKSPSMTDRHRQPMMHLDAPLAPICEGEENSHLTLYNDDNGMGGDEDKQDESAADTTEEQDKDDEKISEDSMENLETRQRHADLILKARKAFPTREALEDCIQLRRDEVEAAVNSAFDVDKETLERAALADEEVRKLLPLRLVLPTMADLEEMVLVLQKHKEIAMKEMNDDLIRQLTSEIEELQGQIDLERCYRAAKRPKGILKRTERS